MYKLFLDDIRFPHFIYIDKYSSYEEKCEENKKWIIKRSFIKACNWIRKFGCPNVISFDHDLGFGRSGYDLAKWLIEKDLDNPGFFPDDFKFYIHSSNTVGKENISKLLNNYFKRVK